MIRVLALVPGGIDNQILFFPTLDDLRRHYLQVEVDVVVEPRSRSAYRLCQAVNKVVPFDFADRNSLADWGNLLGNIREREYDAVLSPGQPWGARLLLWVTGIPTRIGYSGGSGEFMLTHPIPSKTEQYTAEMYHDLLAGLGITTPCPEVTINVPQKDIEWAEAEQKRLGLLAENGNYVLIHDGSHPLAYSKEVDKIYPVENWQKIIRDFQQRQPDLPLVVVQAPENQAWATGLHHACPDLKVTAPDNIGKLAAMIAGASLMLCPDSAPMHLAVAVGTYTIALFGPTDPEKLLPDNDRFVGLKSPTGQIADIPPSQILEQIWGA